MTHDAATHAGGTVHGYVLAHLRNPALAPVAIGACLTVQMRARGVVSAINAGGAVLVYAELPAPNHILPAPPPVPPGDVAAHARLGALEGFIAGLPPGAVSYFDWTRHW
jgi:hypothetical protein